MTVLGWLGWQYKPKATIRKREAREEAQRILVDKAEKYDVAEAAIADYEIVILELNEEIDVLRKEKTDAAREIVGLHAVNTVLTNQMEACKAMRKKVENLEVQLEERDEYENRLHRRLGSLKKKLVSTTAAATEKVDLKAYLDTISKQSGQIKSLEKALKEKAKTSKKGDIEAIKESLPKVVGTNEENRQALEALDTVKRLQATIHELTGTLEDKEAHINILKEKDAQHVSDHLDSSNQSRKQEKRVQELQVELEAEKKKTLEIGSLHEEKELALAAQERVSKEAIACLEAEKQTALTDSRKLQGLMDKKDMALNTQEQTLLEVRRLLNEKEEELASMAAIAGKQTCDHSQFEQQVQEKDKELSEWRNSYQERVQELQLARGKTSEMVDELRRLQDVLHGREDEIAQLRKYGLSANDLHNEIKRWIEAPSECDVPQLQFLLNQWMMNAKQVDEQTKARFDRQEAEYQQKLGKVETSARAHFRKLKDLEELYARTDKKYQELRNGQAAAFDAARKEALILYETSDPQNRPLKKKLFETLESLNRATGELTTKKEELALRTRERDNVDRSFREWRAACEEDLKGWKKAYTDCQTDVRKFTAAFEDCKIQLQSKSDKAASLEKEVHSLKMKRSQECEKHGEVPTLSSRKRVANGKDEGEGLVDAANVPNKRAKED